MLPAYFRPRTLEEALAIRAEKEVTILAGGTDIYPAKAARAGWGDMRHPDVLDISAIGGLRGIEETDTHVRFGALTTWTDLRRANLSPAFASWQAAARDVGGAQVQNRGTLVGNICTASPAGDGAPCLLTLDSEIELTSIAGRRVVPFESFIDGYRHTLCRVDEIVTAILVPKPAAGARGRFLKLGARRYLVISIVMAAGVIAVDVDGIITHARVAVGSCSPVARRLPELESALLGQRLANAADFVTAEHLSSLAPIDDIRGSGAYRKVAALELVRDMLAAYDESRLRAA
jgi:xanthine dehydrogenase small subunit